MKYFLPFVVLVPSAAQAHPGDHSGLSVQGMLTHLLSEPDHIAMIVAGFAVVGLVLYRARARQ